jgi:hypothetical protein
MLASTGWILAAGGLEAANEALFAPLLNNQTPWQNFNWRIVPATAVMAAVVGVIEKAAPKFGVGLGVLVFASVLIVPYGKAETPLQNLLSVMGWNKIPGTPPKTNNPTALGIIGGIQ